MYLLIESVITEKILILTKGTFFIIKKIKYLNGYRIIILYPLRYLIFFVMKKVPFMRIHIFSVMTDSIKRYNFKKN